jgi:hypothetical protein
MAFRVLDQFPFEFYGEHFSVALASDRKLYVPMEAICKAMGLQTHGQVTRIRENDAVAEALVTLPILWAYGDESREREMVCLRLDRLPFWMGTIQPNRIQDEEKRNLIVRYQREFADVAWAAFRREILPDDMLAEMDATLPPDQQQYHQLMDEASAIRHEIQAHNVSLTEHGRQLTDLEKRVLALETMLVGTDFINTQQMKAYQDMVGIVAHQLKRKKKGNEATVHAEVKRAFQVPSYQLIPEADFPRLQKFLRDWFVRTAGPGAAVPTIFDAPSQQRLL